MGSGGEIGHNTTPSSAQNQAIKGKGLLPGPEEGTPRYLWKEARNLGEFL